MEYFLMAVIIGLLVYIISRNDKKFEMMDIKVNYLAKLLESLKSAEAVEKPVITAPEATKPAVYEPPAPTPEKPKPAFVVEEHIIPEEKTPELDHEHYSRQRREAAPLPPRKSWWTDFKEKNPDLEKFIGENLINKIGVLILVLGISYFVKFAIDKNWINEPARAGIGILCGALVMGFAHKLRVKYAAFSSVLVAGAISIFYFTIGIAFHDYHLFSQTVAFIIMVVVTSFSCLISLSYNRKELAVLSLIGGFAVPFMVSTGEGNYIVLFTYIIILDIGILALAYSRKWRIINILSYLFTVVLYGAWLFKTINEIHPPYLGALLFAFAFYFIFILINIINNLRTKGAFNAVELTILGSNTFLFYAAGMIILHNYHPELKGLFTTVLALLNLVYASFLYKKFGLDKSAVYLLIGLTLTFVTLAIPIQFQGNYITLFWAGEAVLLMWLSQKSGVTSYKFGAVVVHLLMLCSLIMDWKQNYLGTEILNIAFNPIFITGIVAVISLVAVGFLLKNEKGNSEQFGLIFNPQSYRNVILLVAIVIGYLTGIFEVGHQANEYISQIPSASAVIVLYHLLFCAAFCSYLWKNKNDSNLSVATIISIVNIVLYAIWFSNLPFNEHSIFMESGINQRIAFNLHYISLASIVYFGYLLYKISRENITLAFLKKDIFIWVAAFLVIFIVSSELMLHALVISNTTVSSAEIQTMMSNANYKSWPAEEIRSMLARNAIESVRSQVIKTGFPILWGILAFLFLIIGIKKQNKSIRIIALALLGLTILKLFLFDIRNASETGKIIAFILLGVLILIISFVYQKIKVLVLDDNKPTPKNEDQ